MSITIDITGNEHVEVRLRTMPQRTRESLKQAMLVAMVDLRGFVASNKLSGQLLKVRTGHLRRSITQSVQDDPHGVTGVVGTNVSYAAVHEYGFKGLVTVREHLRRLKDGNTANVRSHSRKMDLPARSFLRSSLMDKAGTITERLGKAVSEAAHGNP